MNKAKEKDDPRVGFIDGMTNDEYHNPLRGLSASSIKDLIEDPAAILWGQRALKDETKMDAIDFGTDFHLYFLEPEVFKETHKVLPAFNRRRKDEKQAELDLIAEWKRDGITAVTCEDMNKLKAMRDSAMAHPTVEAIMSMKGIAERSYFWIDKRTGVECKCRPDWLVTDINDSNRPAFMPDDCSTLVMDVKTIARIDRIQNQVEELKYYVQDSFYTQGVSTVTGSKVCFVFAFVSTSLSMGRYPVKVVMLKDTAKFDGRNFVSDALTQYARLAKSDFSAWQTVIEIDRPAWAMKNEDLI